MLDAAVQIQHTYTIHVCYPFMQFYWLGGAMTRVSDREPIRFKTRPFELVRSTGPRVLLSLMGLRSGTFLTNIL